MTRRLLTALFATVAVAAASPAAGSASVFITFSSLPDAPARVEAFDFDSEEPVAIEIVRGGATIASGSAFVELPRLEPGDTARTAVGSASYDGNPALGDICVGSSTFTVTRPPEEFLFEAGATASLDETSPPIEATTSDTSPATVTLARPLAAGDLAFVTALGPIEGGMVGLTQAVKARDCSQPKPPDRAPAPGPPGTPGTEKAAPLSGTLAAARLKRLGLARLGRTRTLALPFGFSQPGTVRLKLLARGKVIGTAKKTAGVGEHRVTVALTAAGRRLLRRATRLKLTLSATLTPSRAGEAPQRASIGVTLRL